VASGPDRAIRRLPYHINELAFAGAVVEEFLSLDRQQSQTARKR
jgi:hypothetical protein